MIQIKNNNITMIKGDTAYISVKYNGNYKYKEGDTLTLTLRREIESPDVVLTKQLPQIKTLPSSLPIQLLLKPVDMYMMFN